jgi:hypothetical protein
MNSKCTHDRASVGSDCGGEVERLVLARPRSVGTLCLFAVGSSLPEPPVRVARYEYGRTQLKPQEVVQDLITITTVSVRVCTGYETTGKL